MFIGGRKIYQPTAFKNANKQTHSQEILKYNILTNLKTHAGCFLRAGTLLGPIGH